MNKETRLILECLEFLINQQNITLGKLSDRQVIQDKINKALEPEDQELSKQRDNALEVKKE